MTIKITKYFHFMFENILFDPLKILESTDYFQWKGGNGKQAKKNENTANGKDENIKDMV